MVVWRFVEKVALALMAAFDAVDHAVLSQLNK